MARRNYKQNQGDRSNFRRQQSNFRPMRPGSPRPPIQPGMIQGGSIEAMTDRLLQEIVTNTTTMTQTLSRQDIRLAMSNLNVAYGMGLINNINLAHDIMGIIETSTPEQVQVMKNNIRRVIGNKYVNYGISIDECGAGVCSCSQVQMGCAAGCSCTGTFCSPRGTSSCCQYGGPGSGNNPDLPGGGYCVTGTCGCAGFMINWTF